MWSCPTWLTVTHYDELFLAVHFSEEGPLLALEGLLGRGVCHECESVHTDDGGELISLKGKMEGYEAIQVS